MNRFFFLFILLIVTVAGISQNATQKLVLEMPSLKVPNSQYRTVKLVDVRPDLTNYGIVQLGAFNRKARVVVETPLNVQLSQVMDALVDSSAGAGELFLLLRQLNLAEVTGAFSEKGYCHFRAILFAKSDEKFQKLASVDTVIIVKSMDVTNGLLRQASKALTDILTENLREKPADSSVYTSDQVIRFDRIEKETLPLYTTATYKDGVYKTFEAFANQQPDENTFSVEFDKASRPSQIKCANKEGKLSKISSKELYAFVHNGQPYIATEFGYYPLLKTEDDFYFTGKAKVNAKSGDVVMASVFFGVIGGLIASAQGDATFDMKVDHLGGGFIRMKEVKSR